MYACMLAHQTDSLWSFEVVLCWGGFFGCWMVSITFAECVSTEVEGRGSYTELNARLGFAK